jgi:membrane-bound ClpP family serine protease
MTPLIIWIIALLVLGVALLLAELVLPTQMILGLTGTVMLIGAVALCFVVNPLLGVAALLAGGLMLPLGWSVFLKYWPRSPMGRRVILSTQQSEQRPGLPVQIGQVGQSVSAMRPIGTCDFNGQRLEAVSEYGIIESGRTVKVIALNNRRPVVREVASA